MKKYHMGEAMDILNSSEKEFIGRKVEKFAFRLYGCGLC